ISNLAIQSFKNQLNGNHQLGAEHIFEYIPKKITPAQNDMLSEFPTLEELHSVILDMNKDSAAGPDGFNVGFYSICWDIIKEDLFAAIVNFLLGGSLLRLGLVLTSSPSQR